MQIKGLRNVKLDYLQFQRDRSIQQGGFVVESNRRSKLVPYMVLALLTVCFGADRARAQAALAGKFTLPFEARWGWAVLPAADYTLMLYHKGGTDVVHIRRGQVGVAIVQCIAHDISSYNSSHSVITIVRHGNKGTVLSLDLPQLGQIYFFNLPKGEKVFAQNSPKGERVLAQAPDLIQRIPVLVRGR